MDIHGLSRTFEDLRRQQKVRESVVDFCGLSRTVLSANVQDRVSTDFCVRSRTFAERDLSQQINKNEINNEL